MTRSLPKLRFLSWHESAQSPINAMTLFERWWSQSRGWCEVTCKIFVLVNWLSDQSICFIFCYLDSTISDGISSEKPQVLCLLDLNGSKCPIFAKIPGGNCPNVNLKVQRHNDDWSFRWKISDLSEVSKMLKSLKLSPFFLASNHF